MQIHAMDNTCNQYFGTIYASNRKLSERQEKITSILVHQFREIKDSLIHKTLENYYKSKGYDFIIRPYGSELVSLDAYKGLKIEKNISGKQAVFYPKNERHIGNYDEYSTAYLTDDLKYSFNILA